MTFATDTLRRRALGLSVFEGVLHAVMVGVGESFMGALAVELGHGDTEMALLSSVPLLLGALSQFWAGPLAVRLGGRKRLVVASAAIQAVSHVALIWLAANGQPLFVPFLAIKSLYWISGTVLAPAWSAWMADLTEGIDRGRYFAWRSAIVQGALVASFMAGGVALSRVRAGETTLDAYAWLFAVALVARACSTWALYRQHDEPHAVLDEEPGSLLDVVGASDFRVVVYAAALMFGTHVAAPYFTPYMLTTLHLDYWSFAYLTAASIVTKALAFPFCHLLANRHGLRGILVGSGVLVAVVPFLWLYATTTPELLFVQAFAGIAWAGSEYATFQLFLVHAPRDYRMRFFSISGALSGIGQLGGSLSGSALLAFAGASYLDVFFASGIGRAASLLLLVTALPAVVLRTRWPALAMRIVSVRTGGGVLRRPLTHVIEADEGAAVLPEPSSAATQESGAPSSAATQESGVREGPASQQSARRAG